jgi:uncharacterized protein (DUF1501 family)
MLNRRSFLRSSSLLALSSTVPLFVARSLRAAPVDKDGRVLVIVELDGGNDALNTIVPHADDQYARLRPRLKLDPKRLVKLTDTVGLHPSLLPLEKLYEAGNLAVIPGVGYPNPNRSHFESMAIWHTAQFDKEGLRGYGWLGRAMDPSAGNLFAVGNEVPKALRGRRSSAVAFKRIEEVLLSDPASAKASLGSNSSDDLLAYVQRQEVEALSAAEKLARLSRNKTGAIYPRSELAERLKLVARLLKADVGSRVFYTQQNGFDTHSRQATTHSNLLGEFAEAVAAFFVDLKESRLADRVTLMAFSEFGRTIKENASVGTDHGTAGACFVAGPTVAGGVVGTMPSLIDLEFGEPKMTNGFRGLYAALLANWMCLPTDDAIGNVPRPAIFRSY